MLKAEVKIEKEGDLRCAHGLCAPSIKLTWKQIFSTISQKDPIYGVPDRWGTQNRLTYRYRWVSLLLTLPSKWQQQVYDMFAADQLGSIMAEEIRKEIDAEVTAQILAAFKSGDALE